MRLLKYLAPLSSSLRFRFMSLFLLAFAPLLILILYTALQDRRQALTNLPQWAQNIAQLASRQEHAHLSQVRQTLLAFSESVAGTSLNPRQAQLLAKQFLTASPDCANLGIIDPNGQWLAAARPIHEAVLHRLSAVRLFETPASTAAPVVKRRRFVLHAPHDEPSSLNADLRGSVLHPESNEFLIHSRSVEEMPDDDMPIYTLNSQADQASVHEPSFVSPIATLPPLPLRKDEGRSEGSFSGQGPAVLCADSSGFRLLDLVHRTLQNCAFTMGEFFVDPETVQHSISFARPVLDRFGQIQAIVFATLDRIYPSRAELRAQLPEGATWTELDSDRQPLVRFAPSNADTWQRTLPDPLFGAFFHAQKQVDEALDSRGVPTIYGSILRHSSLTPRPLLGVLTVPKDLLFADANRSLARNLLALAIAAALALVLVWFSSQNLVFRPINGLTNSLTRIAAGDFSARTGLSGSFAELGRLTAVCNQLAKSLEQSELKRQSVSRKLQVVARKLVQIQESERRHIARELHDEIGQSLTVAEMNLQAALQSARQPGLARQLRASVTAVERVVEQVHDLSLNLRPSMLDDLGLEPTLRWYVERQASFAGLQIEWTIDGIENRLDPLIETECFRIAQQALTNIIRHAKARFIAIELTQNDGHLHFRIRDDGLGFNVAAVREAALRGASLGLLSMEERAALAGGGLEVDSDPGRGARLHAWFPLKWRANPSAV